MVGVVAHQRREVERGRQAGLSVREQELEARVRVARAAEAGELPHRPQLAAVSSGMDAARVGILARNARVPAALVRRDVERRVERLDLRSRSSMNAMSRSSPFS